MTFARALTLALGLVAAVSLGIVIGPHVTNRGASTPIAAETPVTPVVQQSDAAGENAVSQSAPRPIAKPRVAKPRVGTPRATPAVISLSPELHKRLKPLLNSGADMSLASEGFRNAEQFAVLAHAARNTDIPFMVLKHRVLDEGKPLALAIGASKPDVNAATEASRARGEAKADFAAASSDIASALGQ